MSSPLRELNNSTREGGHDQELEEMWHEWTGTTTPEIQQQQQQRHSSWTRVRVHERVTEIPRGSFEGWIHLRQIQLPWGVTRLGQDCFRGCTSLRTLVLPNTVIEVGEGAMERSGLEMLRIPSEVFHIGIQVFDGCRSLKHVELPRNVTWISSHAFQHCTALTTIRLPPSLLEIRSEAFMGSGLKELCLPSNVNVRQEAFENCYDLRDVFLPSSLGQTGEKILGDCAHLCSVRFPTDAHPHGLPITVVEQQLVTELCRTDGCSALDRWGLGRTCQNRWSYQKDPHSTVQNTCLFSFLLRNGHRMSSKQTKRVVSKRNPS